MKRFLFLSSFLIILFSCNKKDEKSYVDQASVPAVTNFEGTRNNSGIHLSWSYAYSGSINYFILYYSPGGEETDTISAYESQYSIYPVQGDTNYSFHLKAVDKYENASQRAVLRMSTY